MSRLYLIEYHKLTWTVCAMCGNFGLFFLNLQLNFAFLDTEGMIGNGRVNHVHKSLTSSFRMTIFRRSINNRKSYYTVDISFWFPSFATFYSYQRSDKKCDNYLEAVAKSWTTYMSSMPLVDPLYENIFFSLSMYTLSNLIHLRS